MPTYNLSEFYGANDTAFLEIIKDGTLMTRIDWDGTLFTIEERVASVMTDPAEFYQMSYEVRLWARELFDKYLLEAPPPLPGPYVIEAKSDIPHPQTAVLQTFKEVTLNGNPTYRMEIDSNDDFILDPRGELILNMTEFILFIDTHDHFIENNYLTGLDVRPHPSRKPRLAHLV